MADPSSSNPNIDPNSGFCPQTRIFHSLRPTVPLPPPDLPLSGAEYVLSFIRSGPVSLSTTTAIVDDASGLTLSFSDLFLFASNLAAGLRSLTGLSAGDTAFVVAPSTLHIPVLYFSLLSIGVVVSPANPLSTESELSHLVRLCKPAVAFATRATAAKIPSLPLGTILLDSPEFESMIKSGENDRNPNLSPKINQSDPAVILYSSGTTGRVKGVLLTHRNVIAVAAGFSHSRTERAADSPHHVTLFTLPLFHVFGFFMLLRAVSLGDTSVLMERFDFERMLRALQSHRVTYMPVSPPLVLALAKLDMVQNYDLSSLMVVGCGGAPLGKEVAERFVARFPTVEIVQGYGLTETAAGGTRMLGPDEYKRYGSVGRLAENMEAKIVDPVTGEALLPGQQGELWLRGPVTMKGYVGNDEATAATLDPEGWLKTGDLCYFDSDGFLFIVDRLKELIKYKAYQVPPAELEHLLQSNPEIADAAVIPYPDDEAGQIPMAFVVRKPGSSITGAEVTDFVAKQVAPYKKIRRVAFVNSIPKSPAGKILRRELVNIALSASARL